MVRERTQRKPRLSPSINRTVFGRFIGACSRLLRDIDVCHWNGVTWAVQLCSMYFVMAMFENKHACSINCRFLIRKWRPLLDSPGHFAAWWSALEHLTPGPLGLSLALKWWSHLCSAPVPPGYPMLWREAHEGFRHRWRHPTSSSGSPSSETILTSSSSLSSLRFQPVLLFSQPNQRTSCAPTFHPAQQRTVPPTSPKFHRHPRV